MPPKGEADPAGDRLDKVFSGKQISWAKFTEKRLPFDAKYCQKLVDFFNVGLGAVEDGYLGAKTFRANPLPHMSAFAREIGTDEDTLNYWATIFPEWKAAMQMATDMRNELLKDNALLGNYDGRVATLFLGHYAGIKEKVEPPPPPGLSEVFMDKFDRFLAEKGIKPVRALPPTEDAEFTESKPKEEPAVTEAGKKFKEFREKRSEG